MFRQPQAFPGLTVVLLSLTVPAAACDAVPPTEPSADLVAVSGVANAADGAYVEKGTFSVPAPPVPVLAPCVDPDPIVTGTWVGWYQYAEQPDGSYHYLEHIDWSDVTLVAPDGRTWKPGPGAHESFSFNIPAPDANGSRTIMHNLRARFDSQDGAPDLQVWHTIQVVVGPDGELRVFRVVLPFEAICLAGAD